MSIKNALTTITDALSTLEEAEDAPHYAVANILDQLTMELLEVRLDIKSALDEPNNFVPTGYWQKGQKKGLFFFETDPGNPIRIFNQPFHCRAIEIDIDQKASHPNNQAALEALEKASGSKNGYVTLENLKPAIVFLVPFDK